MATNDTQQIWALARRAAARRKKMMLGIALAVLAGAFVYDRLQEPVYEARTSMIFDEFAAPVEGTGFDTSREVLISNRLEELQSLTFAQEIVATLPEADRSRFPAPDSPLPGYDAAVAAADEIHRNLLARPVRNSNVIEVRVRLHDADLCVAVAKAAVRVFQERADRVKREGAGGVRRFVEEQVDRYRVQLDGIEQTLRTYKEVHRITSFDNESQEILRRTTEAEVLRNAARASRQAAEERLAAIQTRLAAQKQALVPSVIDAGTPWTQKLKQKLVDLQLQAMDLRVQNYPPTHPKLQELERDIEQTKESLTKEVLKLAVGGAVADPIAQIEKYAAEAVGLDIEIESLQAQEAALERIVAQYDKALGSLPEQEFHLARLVRERDVSQKIYNSMLEKLEATRISEAERLPGLRVLDPAQRPLTPVLPRTKLNLALGLLVGVLLGAGAGLVAEAIASPFESAVEVESLTGWTVLASVPAIPGERALISSDAPDTPAAEAYRMLRTNLELTEVGTSHRAILVTSVGPGDGKSTTISNLAASLAATGKRVLLVDAEVRRPRQHTIFGVDRAPGLADALGASRGRRLSDWVRPSGVENLDLITTGRPLPNPGDFLARVLPRLAAEMQALRDGHDVLLLDTPPLLLIHDTVLLATLVDGVVFVVNAHRRDAESLQRARTLLEGSGVRVLGVVLNDVEPQGIYKRYYARTTE